MLVQMLVRMLMLILSVMVTPIENLAFMLIPTRISNFQKMNRLTSISAKTCYLPFNTNTFTVLMLKGMFVLLSVCIIEYW